MLTLKSPYYFSLREVKLYCSKLHLSTKIAKKSKKMMDKIRSNGGIDGTSPKSWLAASIYISASSENEIRTQEELSDIMCCGKSTINGKIKRVLEISQKW